MRDISDAIALVLRGPGTEKVVRGSPECRFVSTALWSVRIASGALYRGSCVVSTECKDPILIRSSNYQDDHEPTVFDRLLFFNRSARSKKGTIGGDSGRQSGRSKKKIHPRQSGPLRTDWKKISLVKWRHKQMR